MKTCILADNQFVTNQGLRALFTRIGIDTFAQAETRQALQEQLRIFPEALVAVDYTLFDFVSMQQMLNVKSAAEKTRWLLFSAELGEHFLRYVLLSDPSLSVVMKNDSEEEILAALQSLAAGAPYVCEYASQITGSNDLVNRDVSPIRLTAAEKTILHEIATGKTTKEIAFERNLSFHTVNSHRKNIFRKLEINNVHEAVKYAVRAGIFDVAEYYI
jgi:DNA-binding NarL/FixJ family response regulator